MAKAAGNVSYFSPVWPLMCCELWTSVLTPLSLSVLIDKSRRATSTPLTEGWMGVLEGKVLCKW